MKNIMLKKIGMMVTAGCFSLVVSVSQAAPLITFSNGSVADANDVNTNFTELETRINTISLTPGPIGDTGLGIVFHSWEGFSTTAWDEKVFIVAHSAGTYDQVVLTYVRTPIDATTGTIEITDQRTLSGAVVNHQVLQGSYDTAGDYTRTQKKTFANDTTTLLDTRTISPGFVLRHNAMGEGMNWATASTITKVYADATPTEVHFGVDSRSLLAVEDITVRNVTYTGCQKILANRSAVGFGGHHQRVSWFCPNGVGMVKQIRINADFSSWMLEFDPTQSTPTSLP